MLKLTLAALAMALGASADVSGNNALSIYAYGDTNACRQTFYQYGACGLSTYFPNTDPNQPLVAMPGSVFQQYGASQNNQLCGKVITMTLNGVTQTAIVADQNISQDNSIDSCLQTWEAFGGHDGDGTLIQGVQWSIAV